MTIGSLLQIFCPFIRQAYSSSKTVIVSDCDSNPRPLYPVWLPLYRFSNQQLLLSGWQT